jgi:dynein light intermediate chain 1
LQEVQNSTKKSPPPKSIILLGDNESGRSTLISRLKGVESVSKGIGLEYHYIDIKDEDRDGRFMPLGGRGLGWDFLSQNV